LYQLLYQNRHDDKLSEDFLHHFPEFNDNEKLAKVSDDDLKTPAAKHKWRSFMKEWEKDIGESAHCLSK
jgi:hypothetical protein